MTRPYELDKLLCLLEERESVLSRIKTIELPEFVISGAMDTPVYKIYLSRFGDLVILRNTRADGIVVSGVSDIDELVEDMPPELADVYLTRAMFGAPKPKAAGRLNRISSIEAIIPSENAKAPQWAFLLSIPIAQCLELTTALFNIFRDDLPNNSE